MQYLESPENPTHPNLQENLMQYFRSPENGYTLIYLNAAFTSKITREAKKLLGTYPANLSDSLINML
jgi:hypothetical protein